MCRENPRLAGRAACFRGIPIQKLLKGEGHYPVIGGINLARYQTNGVKGFLTRSDYDVLKKRIVRLSQPKIMAQNLVAHIQSPKPHVKLIAALDGNGEIVNLDTVTNIVLKTNALSAKFLLALINSTLINWYTYKFIFCSAICTMHLDEYYVGKIPVPLSHHGKQAALDKLVDQIMAVKGHNQAAETGELEREIDQIVYNLYNLRPEEIAIVEGATEPKAKAAEKRTYGGGR